MRAVINPNSSIVATVDDLDQGAMLADKYRIVRVLGRGGMGVVVEAEHVQLDERVAIKFLSSDHLQNKEARERFAREARAVGKLRSEHVARVRDVGELSSGQPYIVMELMVGQDLAQTLLDLELSTATIVDLMLQACEALAEAHAGGLVHRDVKPANMFITHTIDGMPLLKLLDFGVASTPVGDAQITTSGVIVGTPAYMCPEQMRSSRQPEPRWDIWSLGVVMYNAFERRLPFSGEGFAELAVAVLTEKPKPMVETPAGLAAVVMRCLDKDPDARFQTVAEVAAALAPFAATPKQAETSVRRTFRLLGDSRPTRVASDVSFAGTNRAASAPAVVDPGSPARTALALSETTVTPTALRRDRRWWPVFAAVGVAGFVIAFLALRGADRADEQAPVDATVLSVPVDAGTVVVDAPAVDAPAVDAPAVDAMDAPAVMIGRDAGTRSTTPPRDAGRRRVARDAGPTEIGSDAGELTPEEQMKGRN